MSADGSPPDQLSGPHPQVILAAILKVLAEPFTLSERAYEKRLELMALHEALREIPLPLECMGDAAEFYMYVSYTDSPHVIACKRLVNAWFRQLATADLNIVECTRKSVRKDRPVILVPLEAANSGHVMFRTFAKSIGQLRKRFEVVGLTAGDYANFDFLEAFDSIICLDSGEVEQTISAIEAKQPEIILYPSVGMTSWCVALSNIRLAPIQIAFPGHPASTFSEAIDYYVVESDVAGAQKFYSEKLALIPPGCSRSTPKPIELGHADRSGRLKVAIPATAMKIIPPFLKVLREIQQRCPEIEYHFFTHHAGLAHAKIEYALKQWFADCTVYHLADYPAYMNQLNQCSLGLTTFPFGASNSVLDCLLCGIPVLTLEGQEIHERMASSMLRRIQMDSMIAYSVEEYIGKAAALIHDGAKVELPTPERILEEFTSAAPPELEDVYLKVFTDIYEAACA